ncbi:MAG: glucosidase II beta subunit-like-domain-containing protein [Benniella sp.]|nr:MAG: glucosidase II beta subunit-like-domain-containing protein [Benniella sp.]
MKTQIVCIPVLVTVALSFIQGTHASQGKGPRGVAPSRIELYTPGSNGTWRCLDGSNTISSTSINDDYCDCDDGSDEPGTSACGTSYFYCENIGHQPAYIRTSRLNDGVCDSECCDGTDEFNGIIRCPNTCKQAGEVARKERERILKVEKSGGKIRQGYINFGKDAKRKLQLLLDELQEKAERIKQVATNAKDELDKANAKQQEYLESSRIEREKARNHQLEPFIEKFKERLTRVLDDKNMFRATLDMLKEHHNKNYHDLAVKNTISGFDEYLKEIEEKVASDTEPIKDEDNDSPVERRIVLLQGKIHDIRKDIGKMFRLIKEMKESYNTEYNDEAVLKTIKIFHEFAPSWNDEKDDYESEDNIQIPEEASPSTEASGNERKSTIYDRIQKVAKSVGLGSLFKEEKSELALAQEAHDKALEEERKVQKEIEDSKRKLGMDYGKDESFAQLADQCFDLKDAEYTYTLCLFGSATQKSHQTISLGKFSSWIGDNYDTQLYDGGARCWNGPERSVKVAMSCGGKNELVQVSEPNKCEYLFKFRTPALCRLPSDLKDESTDAIPEAIMPGTHSKGHAVKKHDEL